MSDTLISRAYALGKDRGEAAGSWVIDGNTSEESACIILKGIDDGDPAVLDMQPAPLSGEWADWPTIADVLEELEVPEDSPEAEDTLDQYEMGFSDGYWDEVERAARAKVE